MPQSIVLDFATIAAAAGFAPGPDGRFNLPPVQATADALCRAALYLLPPWQPGDEPWAVVRTGAGPVWGPRAIGHALHGRAARLTYAAPNVPGPGITIFNHGQQ
jgi:hypothetical protein